MMKKNQMSKYKVKFLFKVILIVINQKINKYNNNNKKIIHN